MHAQGHDVALYFLHDHVTASSGCKLVWCWGAEACMVAFAAILAGAASMPLPCATLVRPLRSLVSELCQERDHKHSNALGHVHHGVSAPHQTTGPSMKTS